MAALIETSRLIASGAGQRFGGQGAQQMKRVLRVLALASLAATSTAVALASEPTRVYSPFSNDSFSGVCSFTVDREILTNNSYLTTFSDGTQLYTGTFKERLINENRDRLLLQRHQRPAGKRLESRRLRTARLTGPTSAAPCDACLPPAERPLGA